MAASEPDTPSPGSAVAPRQPRFSETGLRVFHCLSLGLVVFDQQFKILHYNPAAEFLVKGHSSVTDALTAGTVDATYQDWAKHLREVIPGGKLQRFDQVVYRHPESGERLLNLQCIPLTDAGEANIIGGTLVIEDVTVAVSMEKRLAVSERMAAVGKLAARVAHELNNPLDGILRYLNLGLRAIEVGNTAKLPDYLQRVRGGLLRMTQIVRELVEFSRSAYTVFDDAGINSIVEEAVKVMADKAAQANVSTICRLQDGMPAIRGTNLFQVFCNMIKNAIDAMPQGGTLTILTEIIDREVIIRFEDTGVGLPEPMERIFEPFFTTKEAGKGTGLGLAICRDIIEKYNGKIVPERGPHGGAVLTVRIPLNSCAIPRPAPANLGAPPPPVHTTAENVQEPK